MNTKGLTLVEVLISLGVLGIIMVAAASGIVNSSQVSRENRINAQAAQYAQAVLERYRILWADASNYNSNTNPTLTDLDSVIKTPLSLNVTITKYALNADGTVSAANPPPLRKVVIEVRQGSASGKLRARLETQIAP